MTDAQRNAFVKYRRDVREKNEQGITRWRREIRAQRDSNLKNLTVIR